MKLSEQLKSRIQKQIALGNSRLLVLIDVFDLNGLSSEDQNSNVYCLNEDQSINWKIQAGGIVGNIDPFVGLTKSPDGSYQASRSNGNVFSIDTQNGTAVHIGWRK